MAALLAFALIVAGIDGSPWEGRWSFEASQRAVRVTTTVQVGLVPDTVPAAPGWAKCPQWWDVARAVGWPEDQLPTMDRVMKCESGCQPKAYNRSGASGLMQVLRSWFGPDEDPFDPTTNLTVALRVLDRQGWRAWSCYR